MAMFNKKVKPAKKIKEKTNTTQRRSYIIGCMNKNGTFIKYCADCQSTPAINSSVSCREWIKQYDKKFIYTS